MKIVYTGGTFDMLHEGHINLLQRCKALGTVIVGLNTDEFVEQFKRKTVLTYDQRRAALLACRYVDAVVKNTGGFDSKIVLDCIDPDIYVHGDDWVGVSLQKQLGIDDHYFKDHDIEEIYVPYTKSISTTDIINTIKSR